MFTVDSKDPTPIYAQLERGIRAAITTGRLAVGDRLPTVRQLAVDLKVNANTVAKVYGSLERVGLLETQRGVGTFVRAQELAAQAKARREKEIRTLIERFLADAATHGYSVDEIVAFIRQHQFKEK